VLPDADIGHLVIVEVGLGDLPAELQQLIATNKTAKARWDKMTTAQQRMLREEVFAAKSSEARTRRAAKNLV